MEKINFVNGQTPAINAANLNQMQDNIEEEIEQKQTYSAEEQVIGTFMGKPLYRKTIFLENITLPANSDGTMYEKTIHDISNVEVVFAKKIYVEMASSSTATNIFKFVDSNTDNNGNYIKFLGFNNNFLIQANYVPYIKKAYIVIEYTKTTD